MSTVIKLAAHPSPSFSIMSIDDIIPRSVKSSSRTNFLSRSEEKVPPEFGNVNHSESESSPLNFMKISDSV